MRSQGARRDRENRRRQRDRTSRRVKKLNNRDRRKGRR